MSTIRRHPTLEAHLLDEMRRSFAEQERTTEKIHVSDLLTPRRAYWSRVLPRPLTDEEIGYFVAGRGHEDAVGRVSGVTQGETREIDGIWLRADFYTSIPLEFKTRRRGLAETDEDAAERYGHYIDQLRAYCALLEREAGWLWVLGLVAPTGSGNGTRPEFQVWEITFTRDELQKEREELRVRRDALRVAWEMASRQSATNLPTVKILAPLPLCPAWQCGRAVPTQLEPPVCDICGQVFASDATSRRHTTGKAGRDHTVRPARLAWAYEPRCRWYDVCQPGTVDSARQARPSAAVETEVPF